METSSTLAQDMITCDLCDNPTQQFCNNCQVSLCGVCINEHVESLKSETHDIVPFKDRREQLIFSSCASHPNQKCEGHCQQCDVPVCFRCLTGPHSGHTVIDMSEVVQQMKEEIKKETEEIESFISRFTISGANIDQKIYKMIEKFKTMEKEGENLRKIWHEEVDNIFDTLQSTIRTLMDRKLTPLKAQQSMLQDSGKKIKRITKENKRIIKSNKVSDVASYKSELKDFKHISTDVDVKIPSLKFNTVAGKELSIKLKEYKATLRQEAISSLVNEVSVLSVRKLLDKAKVITTISTGMKPLIGISCTCTNDAWAHGEDKVIRRINIHGSLKEKITTKCESGPSDISVTRQGELIYSDEGSRTVNIFRKGRVQKLITLPRGWHTDVLCCTRSGDLLVSMETPDYSHHKIVRYQGQTATQEIDKDEHGQNIFKDGKYGVSIEENNNGDLCATDTNAETVIVMDKTGRVRFRYNGIPARRNYSFNPTDLVTDSLSQIIIADYDNECLHILDQNGQFLRCVDMCGLERPFGISVDSEGRLWVGCYNSGDVKVIQYME
ncbi:uncharacterized protein LOC134254059 [Saccostrea cucullata]|uniref:uncharacterized protein LOC134254059 n=1 Tax=Saccostrea cuccullata TaxID=36930 RepID=UPI002ED05B09